MTSADGNTIRIKGYVDRIRPPNDEEVRLVNGMLAQWTAQEPAMRKSLAIEQWTSGMSGRHSLMN